MALNIKSVLNKYRLSQVKVAKQMGISKVALNYMINGNPTIDSLNKIALVIGCDVSELFEKPQKNSFNCPYCGKEISINEN